MQQICYSLQHCRTTVSPLPSLLAITARHLLTSAPTLQSFYDDLGVHPQSTTREIKEAFYKQSKEHHPDRNVDDPGALKKFQIISEAYEILGNPEKRIKYDKGVLGRTSSVAETERASHRFQGEKFYGARGSLKIHRQRDSDRNLDAWVKENSSENFQRLQNQKRYKGVSKYRDNRLEGLKGKSMHDIQRAATAGNSGTDRGLFLAGLFLLVLYAIFRSIF